MSEQSGNLSVVKSERYAAGFADGVRDRNQAQCEAKQLDDSNAGVSYGDSRYNQACASSMAAGGTLGAVQTTPYGGSPQTLVDLRNLRSELEYQLRTINEKLDIVRTLTSLWEDRR